MNDKRWALGGAAGILALLAAVTLALWGFGARARANEWAQMARRASGEAQVRAESFAGKLAAARGYLRGAASAWPQDGDVSARLAGLEAGGGFDFVYFIAADGRAAGADGSPAPEWVLAAPADGAGFAVGEAGALAVSEGVSGGGALLGVLDAQTLGAADSTARASGGASLVVRGGEEAVALLPGARALLGGADLWPFLEAAEFLDGGLAALKEGMASGQAACARAALAGETYVLASQPAGIENWNYLLLLPETALAGEEADGRRGAYLLAIELLALGAAALFVLTLRERAIRRQAQRAQAKLEALIRAVPGGVTRCDTRGLFGYVSEGFERIVGYTAAELSRDLGNDFWALVHPDDAPRVREKMQGYDGRGEPFYAEYRLLCKDGHIADVLDQCVLATDGEGSSYLSIYLDLTEKKRTERELGLRDEWLGAILRCARVRAFEYDIRADAVRGADGARFEGVSGQGLSDFLSYLMQGEMGGREEERALLDGLAHVKKGAYAEFALKTRRPDGQEGYCKVALGVGGAGNERVVGVSFDVAPQAEREAEPNAAQDALTGLMSRRAAERAVDEYLGLCDPYELCAFLAVDIAGVDQQAGSWALREAAALLRKAFRDTDAVARLEEGRFGVFMKDVQSVELVEMRAGQLCERVFSLSRRAPGLRVHIGLSFAPVDGRSFAVLYARAQEALASAGAQGPSGYALCE